MKVKELLQQLQDMDPDIDVLCCSEDANMLPPNHGFRLFDIMGTDVMEGEKRRGEDQIASLKLGPGPNSKKLAFIVITSDF